MSRDFRGARKDFRGYLVKDPYQKIAKIWCMYHYQQQITR